VAESDIAARLKELEDEAADIERQREERQQAERLPYMEQRVADMRRINELEAEHGHGRVGKAELNGWTPDRGAVTMLAAVVPLRSSHRWQKFQQQVLAHRKNPNGSVQAIEELGRNTLAYPHPQRDKDLFDATLEIAPAMLNTVADMVATMADADEAADAKKSQRS
jgi:hypothetical protein